jgi:hypothetical protein
MPRTVLSGDKEKRVAESPKYGLPRIKEAGYDETERCTAQHTPVKTNGLLFLLTVTMRIAAMMTASVHEMVVRCTGQHPQRSMHVSVRVVCMHMEHHHDIS